MDSVIPTGGPPLGGGPVGENCRPRRQRGWLPVFSERVFAVWMRG